MREEIIRRLKSNNDVISELTDELNSKRRISTKDILKTADLIKHIKQMNATYRSLLS